MRSWESPPVTPQYTDAELMARIEEFQRIAVHLNKIKPDVTKVDAVRNLREAAVSLLDTAQKRLEASKRLVELAEKLRNQVRNL